MSKPHGIIVFGASGSGTTTLGRELARILNFTHLDIDDYFWEKSEIPFSVVRPCKERQEMLLADVKKHVNFVMSGSMVDWDEPFLRYLDLAVFATAPTDIRMERLKKREYEEFGDRLKEGGDMHKGHLEFISWAASYDTGGLDMRSLALHEQWIASCPCPVARVDGRENYRAAAARIAERFYTKPGEPWRVSIAPLGTLEKYRFTVIFAAKGTTATDGGWLFCRHKERKTWETAGGHIEAGETPLVCAKRELYEETGAEKFYISPAFDYAVHRSAEFSYGQVFFADVEELGELPPESEMKEVGLFDTLPDQLTYEQITPVIFAEMKKWLNLDQEKNEYWDVLDADRKLTGRTHQRGIPLPAGDYHLVVHAWIVNGKGKLLITRRAFNKISFPGMWEVPSGSAVSGEDSLTGAIREAQEESGIVLHPENAELFSTYQHGNTFYDSWLFQQEFDLADVVLQAGETMDARIATWNEITVMMEHGEYIGRDVYPEFELLEGLIRKYRLGCFHEQEDCTEFRECNRLTELYYLKGDYANWFNGHLAIAEKGYPLAECQVGWAYLNGMGVSVDLEQAEYWTKRAALHGDQDAAENLEEIRKLQGI